MAILKKISGSTLMETLVATVLIIIIFMISGLVLNNIFSNSINNSTSEVSNHFNELQYLIKHDKIELPYTETYSQWQISIEEYKNADLTEIEFEAVNSKTKKSLKFTNYEAN